MSEPIDSFIQEFMKEVASHDEVTNFVLFGSASRGEWHIGSDLDMVVCLSCKAREVRGVLIKKFWELDHRHGTGIRNAPCMHPPIIFLWGWRKAIFRFFIAHGRLLRAFKVLRTPIKLAKRIAPSYGRVEFLNKVR